MSDENEISFNGVNGATGCLLEEESTVDELAGRILERLEEAASQDEDLKRPKREPHLGEVLDVDLDDLGQAGWALVVADGIPDDVLEALRPLRDLRASQAGPLYREFTGAAGIEVSDTKRSFLRKHGIGPAATPRPEQVPYYLLLVGSPEQVSFALQYRLDEQYAVGRIWFETTSDCRRYAEAVVAGESQKPARGVHLFGPRHAGDRATRLSATQLIAPLAGDLERRLGPSWSVVADDPATCTKQRLGEVLSSANASLLFSASHGVGYPRGDPDQRTHQGALVCQDWQGPLLEPGRVDDEILFRGADVAFLDAVQARIMMSFACFGAGTPTRDNYSRSSTSSAAVIADSPFVADLPMKLLAHPRGNLLGFVGHVERAWGCSFLTPGVGQEHHVFSDAIRALAKGWRLGHALQFFNDRYLAYAGEFHEVHDGIIEQGDRVAPRELARLWTAINDARSYVLLGDPAVQLTPPPALAAGPDANDLIQNQEAAADGLGDK